jgi:hypothetical protein
MSVDPREPNQATRRERIDDAFDVKEPAQNPGIGPRLIPVVATILVGVVILLILYFVPM